MDGSLTYRNGGAGTFTHMSGPFAQPEKFEKGLRKLDFSGLGQTAASGTYDSLLDSLIGPVTSDLSYKTTPSTSRSSTTMTALAIGIPAIILLWFVLK